MYMEDSFVDLLKIRTSLGKKTIIFCIQFLTGNSRHNENVDDKEVTLIRGWFFW